MTAARIGAVTALFGVAAAIVVATSWFATGGRWLIVQTPSMGTAAPVGTLLWVAPVEGPVHVGEVISFHPPGYENVTYTHRVHAIAPDGSISTKGDANPAADPWQLTRADVTGRVVLRWWAVGWLVKAAPILIIGGFALWFLLRRFTVNRWKLPAATIGIAVLLILPIWMFRPLVRAQLVLFHRVGTRGPHTAEATYLSTGLLPTRLSAPGASSVVLRNGQAGTVRTTLIDADGRFTAQVTPHLPWWWWVVILAACFVPAVWTAVVGVTPERARWRAAGPVPAG